MATLHTFTQQVTAQATTYTLGGGGQVTTLTQFHNDYAILTQYLTAAAQADLPATTPFDGSYRVTIRGDGDSVAFTLLEGDTITRSLQVGGYGLFPSVRITETITEVGLPATILLFTLIAILIPRRHP